MTKWIMLITIAAMTMWIVGIINYDSGYRHGQIDAINNEIKYTLMENSNGTKTWKKIRQTKEE